MKNHHLNRICRLALIAAAAWSCTAAAFAETVYRCGDSYSQQPCPGGRQVIVEDARTQAQRTQTSEPAKGDARQADAMEKARIREEANPAQALPPPAKVEEPLAAREPQI